MIISNYYWIIYILIWYNYGFSYIYLMQKLEIVPVIDIKDGKAVQPDYCNPGKYTELSSRITNTSNPLKLALTYQKIGFREVYIADLDGILDYRPSYEVLSDISTKTELSVMADIGTWTLEDVYNLEKIKPVIASETFSSLNVVEFPRDFVLSMDMREGEFLSEMKITLDEFLLLIKDSDKIREVMVADLARACSRSGPNLDLCRKVRADLPGKIIIYGGGVRNMFDIKDLYELGVDKILVGTALHSGPILKELYSGIIKSTTSP